MIKIKELKRKCQAYIDGEMTIYNAALIREKLFPVLQDSRDLVIHLANVTEIDSAGVQLLMLAKKDRATNDLTLCLTDHSDAVLDVFELMGLVSYFNDPVVLSGEKGEKHGS